MAARRGMLGDSVYVCLSGALWHNSQCAHIILIFRCQPGVYHSVTFSLRQAKGNKREYVSLAQQLPFYGYMQFEPCTCDFPVAGTRARVSIGNKELNIRSVVLQGSVGQRRRRGLCGHWPLDGDGYCLTHLSSYLGAREPSLMCC